VKILHTSDWHLGKRLDRFDRLDEQREAMEEICQIADEEQVDVVLVAGDLFDSYNPSTAAVELLYQTVARLSGFGKRPVIAIAGNHDSPDRVEAPDVLAREAGILFVGYPTHTPPIFRTAQGVQVLQSAPGFAEIKLPHHAAPLRLLLTPYANEFRLGADLGTEEREERLRQLVAAGWQSLADQHCDTQGINLLIAHLLFAKSADDIPEEPEEEKPIHLGGASFFFTTQIPPQIQYTALGHLHRLQNLGEEDKPVIYSGSPLPYSFGEAGQQKYVVLLDAEPGVAIQHRKIALSSGRKVHRFIAENREAAEAFLTAHPNDYVELSLRTDKWISAADRKHLLDLHNYLVGPLPLPINDSEQNDQRPTVDLSEKMETLFAQYFERQKGQQPGERMMQLFREMMAEEADA
jgi:exonuclease SbcD